MSVYVFTFHTKCSWMPDNPRGYVKRGKGILAPSAGEAEKYRRRARHDEFTLTDELQRILIDEARTACRFQKLRVHLVATEPTHVHVLVSWKGDKPWQRVRDGLKTSLTRALRKALASEEHAADREYFSRGSSRKRIRTPDHFEYWMHEYGPSHRGWKWREDAGAFK